MLVPAVMGSDKTTVSVMTGNNEYYPLYLSLGNLHNEMRCAHLDSVLPVAFLAIPKCTWFVLPLFYTTDILSSGARKYDRNKKFLQFCWQLFHSSLAAILHSLRPSMMTGEVLKCPDGHYRCVVFVLGPYIADYPEQVLVTCTVSGWCPKYVPSPWVSTKRGTTRLMYVNLSDASTTQKISTIQHLICKQRRPLTVLWRSMIHGYSTTPMVSLAMWLWVNQLIQFLVYTVLIQRLYKRSAFHPWLPLHQHTRAYHAWLAPSNYQRHLQGPLCRLDLSVPEERAWRGACAGDHGWHWPSVRSSSKLVSNHTYWLMVGIELQSSLYFPGWDDIQTDGVSSSGLEMIPRDWWRWVMIPWSSTGIGLSTNTYFMPLGYSCCTWGVSPSRCYSMLCLTSQLLLSGSTCGYYWGRSFCHDISTGRFAWVSRDLLAS